MSMTERLRSEQALENLLKYCHVKSYPAKTTLLSTGKVNNKLFFIQEGSVSIGTEEENGRELIYTYLNEGDFMGEVGFFTDEVNNLLEETKTGSVIIKTRCPCKLAEIPHQRLHNLLKNEVAEYAVDILFLIAKQVAERLLIASRNFRDLAFMDTRGRIARKLIDLCQEPDAKPHANGIQIKITRQELSRIVGCSREIVGGILKELEQQNMIKSKGKIIIVFNPLISDANENIHGIQI